MTGNGGTQGVFATEDIVKNGMNAERYLAKYPYSAVYEKIHHKTTAVIGKLAERGFIEITKPISDEEWNKLCDEVEKEVIDIRKNGAY